MQRHLHQCIYYKEVLLSNKLDCPAKPSHLTARTRLSEAEQAELEEFLSNVKILTATLGYKIFEALDETVDSHGQKEQMFYCRNGAGAFGEGSPSTEGFVVFKGALFIALEQPSIPNGVMLERQKMIKAGILVSQGTFYILTRDYVFSSSSRAAAAVLARSASGPLEWKTNKGISLKQLEE